MSAELPLEPERVASADELRARLRRKFPANEYAMLYEVRDAAGFHASRSADVVIVGLWPSRGCRIEGMEIKISRTDWLRELKKPEKAEAFVPYCDRWWVVAGHQDVVKLSELPPTWGLMVPSGKGLGISREAPALEPKPIDRSMLAAMLKRATSTALDDPEVSAFVEARVKAEKERFNQTNGYQLRAATSRAEALEQAIKDFEQTSGVAIRTYQGRQIGEAVLSILNGEHQRKMAEARALRDKVVQLAAYMTQHFQDESSSEGKTAP